MKVTAKKVPSYTFTLEGAELRQFFNELSEYVDTDLSTDMPTKMLEKVMRAIRKWYDDHGYCGEGEGEETVVDGGVEDGD